MMGTGPFAVPTFTALLDSRHPLAALVTRPDRPVHDHRKQKEAAPQNPMREVARQRAIEVFEPESVNSPEAHARLEHWVADLFVVCDFGQILSRDTLALSRLGGINIHGSLLPKYRGAAPIQWAIFHGATQTGVSVIHMTPQLDAGPVLVQRRLAIDPDETAAQLEPRLASLGPSAVLEAIDCLVTGDTSGIPQDPMQATKAPRLKKADGLVDWGRAADEIRNQVRAMEPWPKTYTFWRSPASPPIRLILESVATRPDGHSGSPGSVVAADAGGLVIRCGTGSLAIHRLQPAGKRSMSAGEFLRGHVVQPGQEFGDESA
jgi:methionyl-tRNA formyltransferase